jgi:hypothetical protein
MIPNHKFELFRTTCWSINRQFSTTTSTKKEINLQTTGGAQLNGEESKTTLESRPKEQKIKNPLI